MPVVPTPRTTGSMGKASVEIGALVLVGVSEGRVSYTEADLKAAWDDGFRLGRLCGKADALLNEVKKMAMKLGIDLPTEDAA